MPALTRYLRATVTLPSAPERGPLPVHRRRRGRRLRQRHAGHRHQGRCATTTRTPGRRRRSSTSRACCTRARTRSPSRSRTASTPSGGATPGGFIARLKADGTTFDTSSAWKSSTTGPAGWEQPALRRHRLDARARARHLRQRPVGRATSPSRRSRARTCARTSRRAKPIASAPACTSPRSASTRSTSTAPRSATRCSRRAGRSTPSASRPRPTTSRAWSSSGDNAIGAVLGDGWYAGRLQGGRKWGTDPALLAQLKITYADGTSTRVATDDTLAGRHAAACSATSIYDGETYDARLDRPAGTSPASTAAGATRSSATRRWRSSPTQAPPIKVIQTLQPVKTVTQPKPGTYDLRPRPELRRLGADHGPGRRGHDRSRCASARSSTTTARSTPPTCARAQQTDTYTLRGHRRAETYEPRFTYHGFRYVEVTGCPDADARRARRPRGHAPTCPSYGTFTSSQRARQPDPERDPLGPALELPRRPERRLPARRAPRLDR